MKRLILGALLLTAMSGAWAVDKEGNFRWRGAGSCGDYVKQREAKDALADVVFKGWVAGYTSFFNSKTPDTYDLLGDTDLNSVMLWLEKYCRAHPLNHLGDGIQDLADELYPRRYRTRKDTGN